MRGGLFCFADSQFLSFYKCMKYDKCGFRVMGIKLHLNLLSACAVVVSAGGTPKKQNSMTSRMSLKPQLGQRGSAKSFTSMENELLYQSGVMNAESQLSCFQGKCSCVSNIYVRVQASPVKSLFIL